MIQNFNPAADTWNAVKTRLAGPFGSFVLVWTITHPAILAFVFFDAAGDSKISQADAKISKITGLLSKESNWDLLWLPLLYTACLMVLIQFLTLGWHYVSECFRYYQERITAEKDFKVFVYKKFGSQPLEVIETAKNQVNAVKMALNNFQNIGQNTGAGTVEARYQARLNAILAAAAENVERLEEVAKLLTVPNNDPILEALKLLKK